MRISDKNIDRVYVERFIREKSFKMPKFHLHPYYELYYVETGTVRAFIKDGMYDLEAGDLLIISPQIVHYMRYYGDIPCKRTNVFFRKDDIKEVLEDFDILSFREKLMLRLDPAGMARTENILSLMLDEEEHPDVYSEEINRARLSELLMLSLRHGDEWDALSEELHTGDKCILAAAGYMSSNFRERISLDDISAAAGLSPNYLSTKFRELTGMGVHDYLQLVRLKHASALLAGSRISITEVALECGFSGSNYFKDAFKKAYGITPGRYRKENRPES